jgi:hypothetical protein
MTRVVVISSRTRPHIVSQTQECWCHPNLEECEDATLHFHKEPVIAISPQEKMSAYSDQYTWGMAPE